jgi:hypothetical protein
MGFRLGNAGQPWPWLATVGGARRRLAENLPTTANHCHFREKSRSRKTTLAIVIGRKNSAENRSCENDRRMREVYLVVPRAQSPVHGRVLSSARPRSGGSRSDGRKCKPGARRDQKARQRMPFPISDTPTIHTVTPKTLLFEPGRLSFLGADVTPYN